MLLRGHLNVASWLDSEVRATSPVRRLYPQLRTWEAPPANVACWLEAAVRATPRLRPNYPREPTFKFELPLFWIFVSMFVSLLSEGDTTWNVGLPRYLPLTWSVIPA